MRERVSLRPIERSDLDRIREWLSRVEISEGIQTRAPSPEEQAQWFDRYMNDPTKRVFAVLVENRHVGNVSLFNIDSENGTAMLTVFVGDPACRGKGIGTESVRQAFDYALRQLRLRRISLEVHAENLEAIRCYEKLGMTRIATLPGKARVSGRAVDMFEMAVDLDAVRKDPR